MIDDDSDSTEVYTSDEESQGANAAQLSNDSESVDGQEYYSDSQSDEEDDTDGYTPPTPPRSTGPSFTWVALLPSFSSAL